MTKGVRHAVRDLFVFAASLVAAYAIIRFGLVHALAEQLSEFAPLGFFIAGFFFTSFATIVPAGVALGEFSQTFPLPLVALVGALGSVCADLLLFRLSRDHVREDLRALLSYPKVRRLRAFLRTPSLRFFSMALGALIIASPLPDELGVTLMGLSRTDIKLFIAVAYVFNFIGIFAIGTLARGVMW